VGLKEYERIILQDAALTAKILRTANSPYFGGGGRITSLQRAAALLGVPIVRSICLTLTFQSSLSTLQLGRHFHKEVYWRHNLSVACIAKALAVSAQYPKPEEAFLAGLLHDIGKLALNTFLPVEALRVFLHTVGSSASDYEAEQDLLGVTHEEVGRLAAEKWNLPTVFWGAISRHHQPFQQAKDPDTLTLLVHVANTLAHDFGMGMGLKGNMNCVDAYALAIINVSAEQCAAIGQSVFAEVERLCEGMSGQKAA
jgi:putative nucleotidyltransferase with HDIG domain